MPSGTHRAALSPPAPDAPLREEPRRVLLVEDDDDDALIVSDLLRQAWPGLEIERVADLKDDDRPPLGRVDCVLLDLGLPHAMGLEALSWIRSLEPDMPIVVLTGDSDARRGIAALGAGAQDYLVKGAIDGRGLARAIRHSVQRKLAERYERELAVLRVQTAENQRLQRGLVARPLLDDPRITIASAYRPGNRRQLLGGDFFDVVQTRPGELHAVIGDVCGHGPDEAALGVQLRVAWRTLVLAGVDQLELLGTLDRLFTQERHEPHLFATLASVWVDLDTGRAEMALAGHPAPMLLRPGSPRLLSDRPGGPPLGVDATPSWRILPAELGPGWALLMFSDGIYEGRAAGATSRVGLERLTAMVGGDPDGPAGYLRRPEALIDHMEELNRGPLPDDVALLALTSEPGGERAGDSDRARR